MPNISRRAFMQTVSLGAASLAAAPLTGWPGAVFAGGKGKVRVGIIGPSHCALPMVYAQLNNAYQDNGIETELVFLPDALDIAKGLANGELDVGQLITPLFFSLHTGNGPFKGSAVPLVTGQVAGTNGGVVVRQTQSDIKLPKDLKGKTIGVHSPLMVHSLLLQSLLKRNGIDATGAVTLSHVDMEGLIPALKKGEIDAFINPEPLATAAVAKGIGRDMILTKALWKRHPCCLVSMRREYFEKQPDLAEALYRSTLSAGLALNDVKTRMPAIEHVHRDVPVYQKLPLAVLKKAFMPGRSDFDPFPFASSGKAVALKMQEFGVLPVSVDTDRLVADTFMPDLTRKLMTDLGARPPAKNSRPEIIAGEKVVS